MCAQDSNRPGLSATEIDPSSQPSRLRLTGDLQLCAFVLLAKADIKWHDVTLVSHLVHYFKEICLSNVFKAAMY